MTTTSTFDLSGKVALITGSTRGIGKSIAEEMAKLGAKVVISSRKADACEATLAEFKEQGFDAIARPCNIGRKEDLEALVKSTLDHYGRIDSLVCNAAINPVYGPQHTASDDAFDKIMASNMKSTWWLCNMVLPQMAERKDGTVIVLSSVAAIKGNPVIGLYGVSKAAEAQYVRNLAVEWGPANIRVNAIAPGLIRTDFAKALWEDPANLKQVERLTPLRRIGDPKDIGALAAFLASDGARFITGQLLVADGGATITETF